MRFGFGPDHISGFALIGGPRIVANYRATNAVIAP